MRINRISIPALFIFILSIIPSCTREPVTTKLSLSRFTEHLDKRLSILMNRYDVPGVSIALIRDGKLAWSHAYGYADVDRNHKMNVNAVFRAESISKSVTAWGVMKLVEQNQISLDEPVQTYLHTWKLPDSKYPENKVTVRRLLSNTSGMPLGTLGAEYPP